MRQPRISPVYISYIYTYIYIYIYMDHTAYQCPAGTVPSVNISYYISTGSYTAECKSTFLTSLPSQKMWLPSNRWLSNMYHVHVSKHVNKSVKMLIQIIFNFITWCKFQFTINTSTLIWVIVWYCAGDKPLSQSMMSDLWCLKESYEISWVKFNFRHLVHSKGLSFTACLA